MTADPPPEADRRDGAPHPRETPRLFGQDAAEAEFLAAWGRGRLHHGWLVTGPRGTGKATLAWRLARALLARDDAGGGAGAGAPPTLDVAADHPVMRRTRALAEPRLFLLRPGWDDKARRLRDRITVDETRAMRGFFAMSAADGGRRVVIVDAADDLNPNAANALLKTLEEPPPGAVLLLVAHQPARLLPTIRSRCRALRCRPLAPDALAAALEQAGSAPQGPALAELSGGSVGAAIDLAEGAEVYARLLALIAAAPGIDRPEAIALAEGAGARGAAQKRDRLIRLLDLLVIRLARTGAGHPPAREAAPGESAQLARLAPDPAAGRAWAALQSEMTARAGHAVAVNLDPATLILDMLLRTEATAAAIFARP